jgi:hypothetical protein
VDELPRALLAPLPAALAGSGWKQQSPTLVLRGKHAALHFPQAKEVKADHNASVNMHPHNQRLSMPAQLEDLRKGERASYQCERQAEQRPKSVIECPSIEKSVFSLSAANCSAGMQTSTSITR